VLYNVCKNTCKVWICFYSVERITIGGIFCVLPRKWEKTTWGKLDEKKHCPPPRLKIFSTNLHEENVQTKLKCHDKKKNGKTEI